MRSTMLSIKNLFEYLDVSYIIKFIMVLVGFYYFNLFFLGITDPKNYYIAFLDHHLNYISWLNTSILTVANIIDHKFNVTATVSGNRIYVPGGATVFLSYACLGFGIMGFWIAFIIAHKAGWKNKLLWCLSGAIIIWFINCWRIAILMLALQNNWDRPTFIDHHDMFNIVAYILILTLMWSYTRQSKKKRPGEMERIKA